MGIRLVTDHRPDRTHLSATYGRDLQNRGRERQCRFHRHRTRRPLWATRRQGGRRSADEYLRAPCRFRRRKRTHRPPRPYPATTRSSKSFPLAEDETIRDNAGNVQIEAAITPPLRSDHRLLLVLDGTPTEVEAVNGVFELSNVDRGTHTAGARAVDRARQRAHRKRPGDVQSDARLDRPEATGRDTALTVTPRSLDRHRPHLALI